MRVLLSLAMCLWFAFPAAATVAQYHVRGVKSNDKLNVRAAPSHTARIVGRIPHNGREIEIIAKGKGAWVKIAYGRTKGFVNRQFLVLSKPRAVEVEPAPAAPAAAPAVTVEPKALEAPAAVATPAAPTPVQPATVPAAPAKLEAPAPAATSLPGANRDDGDDTPALMKPPAEMVPESVPVPQKPAN